MAPQLHCTRCGSEDRIKWNMPAGFVIEAILFGIGFIALLAGSFGLAAVFFVIFGIVVAAKYTSRTPECAACGSVDLIPADSPKAREFANRDEAFQTVHQRIQTSGPHQPIAEKVVRPRQR